MKRKLYLIIALATALILSSGTFAMTYNNASNSIGIAEPTGNLAMSSPAPAPDQPDWDSLLPQGGNLISEILRPEAPGDSNTIDYQFPESGQHWDKVADGAPDEFATYIYSERTQYRRDLYRIQDHGYGDGPIISVTVYLRVAGIDPWSPSVYARPVIKTNNTIYTGNASFYSGANFGYVSYQWMSNPKTGLAWTWDEVDALQAGLDLATGSGNSDAGACTQVYVDVTYEEPPIVQGDVPAGDLYIITPHPDYTGDLQVKVYLTNAGSLVKAYRYLNIKLRIPGSDEAGEDPDYQIVNLENGNVTFNLSNAGDGTYPLEVIGGSYRVVSGNSAHWTEGWTLTPEFFVEVTQR